MNKSIPASSDSALTTGEKVVQVLADHADLVEARSAVDGFASWRGYRIRVKNLPASSNISEDTGIKPDLIMAMGRKRTPVGTRVALT